MSDIFDRDGNLLGTFELSESQLANLDKNVTIAVQYHTPQLLQYKLGNHSGMFMLAKIGGKIVAPDIEAMKAFLALQLDIRRARES